MTDLVQKQNAPSAVAALVLGICSIVFGCWGVGLVCGIIGLVLAKKAAAALAADPENLTGEGMIKAAKITSIIGIVLGALGILYWLLIVAVWGAAMSSIIPFL